MAIDFESKLLAPAYRLYGQQVTFPLDGATVTLTVIDDTTDVTVGSIAQIDTTRPAIRVRMSDLDAVGISPADLIGVEINWRDRAYTIRRPVDNPLDGVPGEVLFILAEA